MSYVLDSTDISASRIPLGKKAADLKGEGRSIEWIAQHFNQQGFSSPKENPWNARIVYDLIATMGEKVKTLRDIHLRAIVEAHGLGSAIENRDRL